VKRIIQKGGYPKNNYNLFIATKTQRLKVAQRKA
jgi:hypothetical protein